jgi:plastocyanin
MKRLLVLLALLVFAVVTAVVPALATSVRESTTAVTVSGKEFSFTLSKKSGPRGTFVFRFKNVGNIAHDFKIAGKKTPLIQPGQTARLTVRIAKAGRYPYLCTVPGHAAAGMKGVFVVR